MASYQRPGQIASLTEGFHLTRKSVYGDTLCLLLERCAGGCRDALSSGFVCGCCSLPARKRTQGCPSLGSVANTCDQQVALIVFRTQEPAWCGPELVPPHSCCLCHSLPGRRGRTIHPCLCDSTEPRRCNLRLSLRSSSVSLAH